MRPSLVSENRAYWLTLAKRLDQRAETAQVFEKYDEAAGLRKAAHNFRERALGNPTPEINHAD